MQLNYFLNLPIRDAGLQFFKQQLGIELSQYAVTPVSVEKFLSPFIKNQEWLDAVVEGVTFLVWLMKARLLKNLRKAQEHLFANEPHRLSIH